MISFEPFTWKSEPPADIPFPPSNALKGIRFLGRCSDYRTGDTIYPTWAEDGNLYSPWTDGTTNSVHSNSSGFASHGIVFRDWEGAPKQWEELDGEISRKATTGNLLLKGEDPLDLQIEVLGLCQADPYPYGGRYPCGSLVHDGVWYYGTYCLSPYGGTPYGDFTYNWPHLGPFVGFRISTDLGKTWKECPHKPHRPLFGERGLAGYPVKIGSPHFVDFGKNMEHSPDGKAYLVAHGSDLKFYPVRNFAHLSWITGDQVYLVRVTPGLSTMNDPAAYEYFVGYSAGGTALWSSRFTDMRPMLEWQDRMGCVTITYDAPLRKYLMLVTDGVNTCGRMHSYMLESDRVDGPWKLVSYMKDFGEQGYFLNCPSKFISPDGRHLWLCYSGNFAPDWNGITIKESPPGSRYGMVLQEIELL